MKLFVVFDSINDEIVAISEDKKTSYMYLLQNDEKNYQLTKVKDEKMIEKISILYDDLYIEEFEGFYMTHKEYKQIDKKIEEEIDRVKNVLYGLTFMIDNYKFKEKERKAIKKTIKILKKNTVKEKFYVLIMIKDFIIDLLGIRNKSIKKLFESINSMDDEYYYIIID